MTFEILPSNNFTASLQKLELLPTVVALYRATIPLNTNLSNLLDARTETEKGGLTYARA